MRRIFWLITALLLGSSVNGLFAQPFVHPGGLHTQADFDRMAAKVAAGEHPWIDSYNQLTAVSEASLGWSWAPVTQIVRGGTLPNNYSRSQKDALAIYYLALRWRVTGNTNYAEAAIVGMNKWSSTMTSSPTGDSNYALACGICGYEFAVAGETLRGYTNWSPASMNAYSNFLTLFSGSQPKFGTCLYFLGSHQGTCDSHYWCNWDACNLAAVMAIGVFCDDTNLFNYGVNYLKTGVGNGNLTSAAWYIHTNGLAQWQESGRDQAHTIDGVMWLGVALQVAWNQGVDLYSFDNNRYLRGIEYVAKYNLGNDEWAVPMQDCDFYTGGMSSGARGATAPEWDMLYNHYVNIEGLQAPWTSAAAAAIRPDGFFNNPNSPDFVGFSTLTCYRDPIPAGAVPSGLTTSVSGTNVTLTWWGSAYATNYLVKRATVSGGPYTTIATVPATADRYYVDTVVTNGGTYYYAISEQDKFGESANSPEKSVTILNQLVAYYKFDEGNNAFSADSSGFGRPAAIFKNSATSASGKFGDAVNLNGSSQYVQLPNGLIAGLHDFTISAWVYMNSVSTWMRLFDFGADIDRYMYLTVSSGSGAPRFAITKFGGPGEQQINASSPLSSGAWHQLAVTLKAGDGNGVGVLYMDGQPIGTNSSMTYYPDMIGSLINCTNSYIGRSQYSGDPYLNARVDDFRIYNGAMSASQISALYALNPVVPLAPATLNATAVSASVINLNWTPVIGATNYVVQRSTTNGGPYAVIASGVTATNYTDTSLSGGTTYYYVVNAVNSGGVSANSSQTGATTLTPPVAPTGLNATGLYGSQIALSWNSSAGATSYNIKRSVLAGGPYVTIATGVTATTYTNGDLILNATYYYVVSAVNVNGESPNSLEAGSIVPVPTLTWQGNVNTTWDIATTSNWLFNASGATYIDGAATIFNDAANTSLINLTANVVPYSMVFNNASLNYTISSANGSGIGGSGPLTKSGNGTLTLNTANDFSGDITLNAGSLTLAGSSVLGNGDYPGGIANYGTLNFNSSAPQILSGGVSKTGSLSKNGSGLLTLSGGSSFSGNLFVKSGQMVITTNGSVNTGNYSSIGASGSDNGTLTVKGDGSFSTSSDLNIGDIGSSVGTLNVQDNANLSVNGFFIGSANASGSTASGTVNMNGGTLTENNTSVGYFVVGGRNSSTSGGVGVLNLTNGYVSAACAIRVGDYGTGTINQYGGELDSVSSGGGVNLHRENNSSSHGSYNLSGGLLKTWNVTSSYGGVNSLFYFNGGTLQAVTAGTVMNNLLHAYVRNAGAVVDDGGFSVAIGQSLEHSVLGGDNALDGGLTKNGKGTLLLTANNTYTGGTTVNAGTLEVGSGGSLSSSTAFNINAGSTLQLDNSGQTVGLLSGQNGGNLVLNANNFTFGNASNSVFAGTISGNGSVTKTGTGRTTISSVNTYTGATVINNGTLAFGQSDTSYYVNSLGPVLKLTFDQTNGGDVYLDDNGDLVTNPIVAINTGLGGTNMNGMLAGAGATIVNGGRYGNALSLDGTSSVFINSPVTALDCNASGASWTYALWIKTSTAGATYGYQGNGGWSSGATTFYLNNNNATSSGTKAGGVRYADNWLTGTTTLNDNAWHFIAITVSNGVKTIYVDGNVDAQTGTTGWNAVGLSSANQFWIGQTPDTSDGESPFAGLIDEVYMFNRALSQSEVTNIMASQTVQPVVTVTGALPPASPVSIGTAGALDLAGTSQSINSLSDVGGSGGLVTNSAGVSATLTFNNVGANTFSGIISDISRTNAINLVMNGDGTQILNGANSYHGNTTVATGTLAFGEPTLPAGGTVTINNGATLNLNYSGTNVVGSLWLNGTSQLPGVYNAANSSSFITGTGSLLITNATPAAPIGLVALAGNTQIALGWNASTGATSYNVKRATVSGGSYPFVTNVTTTAYIDTGLNNGTTYYYVVSALNDSGESFDSSQVNATPLPPPAAPATLTATASSGLVVLNWSAAATASGYNVWRSQASGSGYLLINSLTNTSYTDTGVMNNQRYYYVVSATNSAGTSGYSPEASALPLATVVWSGATNGNWDLVTSNWLGGGYSAVYQDGYAAQFDDTALSNTTVTLTATHTPGEVIVNNSSKTYILGGSAIAGTGNLVKSGSGKLTLSGANTFSGGTVDNGGYIVVSASTTGSAGSVTAGPLGTGTVTLGGGALSQDNVARTLANAIVAAPGTTSTLGSVYASANINLYLTGALSGSGALQNDPAQGSGSSYSVFLQGDLSGFTGVLNFTGAYSGSGANWRVGANNSMADLSHASVVISGGNSKNFGFPDNANSVVLKIGSLSGSGYFQGSYFNSGSGAACTLALGYLNADDNFSGQVGVTGNNMANFNLVKTGTGKQFLTGVSIYTGLTTVSNGELVVSPAFTGGGGVVVNGGATFGATNTAATSAAVGNLILGVGAALDFQNVASTITPLIAAGNVTNNGACTVKITGTNGLVAGSTYPLVSYSGVFNGSLANYQLQMPYGWRGILTNVSQRISVANVAVVSTAPTRLNVTNTSSQLQLSWPADHTGWRLVMSTNLANANWTDVTSNLVTVTNQFAIPVAATNGSVFFRLVYP